MYWAVSKNLRYAYIILFIKIETVVEFDVIYLMKSFLYLELSNYFGHGNFYQYISTSKYDAPKSTISFAIFRKYLIAPTDRMSKFYRNNKCINIFDLFDILMKINESITCLRCGHNSKHRLDVRGLST